MMDHIHSPTGFKLFRAFLEKKYAEENLDFIVAVRPLQLASIKLPRWISWTLSLNTQRRSITRRSCTILTSVRRLQSRWICRKHGKTFQYDYCLSIFCLRASRRRSGKMGCSTICKMTLSVCYKTQCGPFTPGNTTTIRNSCLKRVRIIRMLRKA